MTRNPIRRNSVLFGDCLEWLKKLDSNTFSAVVTDPPYGLEFMGKDWDAPWKANWQSGGGFSKPGIGDRKTEWPSFSSTSNFAGVNPTCGRCGGRARGANKCSCESPQWKPIGKRRNPENEGLPDDVTGGGMAYQMRMFQRWTEAWAKEVIRVLKPGGHLLSFAGTRTFHRMTCGIEEAGFQIRDEIDYYCELRGTTDWVYGSGFPKSLNISLNIEKTIDKIDFSGILKTWKKNLKIVKHVDGLYPKKKTEDGNHTPKNDSVLVIAVPSRNLENKPWPVIIAELQSQGLLRYVEKQEISVQEGAEHSDLPLKSPARSVGLLLENQSLSQCIDIFIVQCDVRALLNERINHKDRDEEVLKTWLGKWMCSGQQDSNALYVELIESLKHTILSQSKTFQNLDTKYQMDFVSAINATITESTAECLISFTEDTLRSLQNEFSELGTALKPAHEPIAEFSKSLPDGSMPEPIQSDAPFCYEAKASTRERNYGCKNLFWLTTDDGTKQIDKEEYTRLAKENSANKDKEGYVPHRVAHGNIFPTVKPINLMKYLVKMVKMPGDNLILDPFCGSGTTAVACILEGCDFLTMDSDPVAYEIANTRIHYFQCLGKKGLK